MFEKFLLFLKCLKWSFQKPELFLLLKSELLSHDGFILTIYSQVLMKALLSAKEYISTHALLKIYDDNEDIPC